MRLLPRRSQEIFLTHTPEAYPVGTEVAASNGRRYRVVRHVEQAPTRLRDGSTRRCWSVRGVKA